MTIQEKIIKFLRENLVSFETLNHEPVFTSEEAARVRGLNPEMGAKSLLLRADDQFVLAVLPGDKKLNTKKLKEILKAKNIRFANPEEVEEKMFCQIGACYPFGNLIDLPMYVDPSLGENEIIAFSPGVHNRSIKIKWADYQRSVEPNLVDII
jgi:Ala-tRNA(Pro) deacylase